MFAYTHWLNHRRMGVQSCMRLTCVSSTSVQVCRPIHHHLYSTRGNSGRCGRALFTLAMVFYKKWWVLREIESVRRYYKSEPTILPINQAARYLQRELEGDKLQVCVGGMPYKRLSSIGRFYCLDTCLAHDTFYSNQHAHECIMKKYLPIVWKQVNLSCHGIYKLDKFFNFWSQVIASAICTRAYSKIINFVNVTIKLQSTALICW